MTPTETIQKIYGKLTKEGYYKGTPEQFSAGLKDDTFRERIWRGMTDKGLYSGTREQFGNLVRDGLPHTAGLPDIPEGATVHVGNPLPPGTVIVDPATGEPTDTIKAAPAAAQPMNYVETDPLSRMDDMTLNRQIVDLRDKSREIEEYNRRTEGENRRRQYGGIGGSAGMSALLSSANRGTLERGKPVMLEKRENPYARPLADLERERLRRDRTSAGAKLDEMRRATDLAEQQHGEDIYTKTARKLQRDTEKLLSAPSRLDSDRSRAWWEGFSDQIANSDTWSGGITEIARSLRLGDLAEKLEKGGSLTDSETLALESYADYVDAKGKIEPYYSAGYRIGQGTAASVPFTVEMIATAGLGAAAKKALVSSLVKAGRKEAAEKLAKALGGVTLRNAVKDPITGGIIRDSAGKAVKEAVTLGATKTAGGKIGKEVAETVLQTAAMPATWAGVSSDRLDTLLSGEDYDFLDFARSFTDNLVETFTERTGGKLIDRAFSFIPTQKLWGGLHGVRNLFGDYVQSPLGETGEEYIGAIADYARSFNPLYSDEENGAMREEARRMFTAQGFGETFLTVLPMSLLGGGINAAQYGGNVRAYRRDKRALHTFLTDTGMPAGEADRIISAVEAAENDADFIDRLSTLKASLDGKYAETNPRATEAELKEFREKSNRAVTDYFRSAAAYNGTVRDLGDRIARMTPEEQNAIRASFSLFTRHRQRREEFLSSLSGEYGLSPRQIDAILQKADDGTLTPQEQEIRQKTAAFIETERIADAAQAEIARQMNTSNGMVQNVTVGNSPDPLIVKAGRLAVVQNPDGSLSIDKAASDPILTLANPDGSNPRQTGIGQISSVIGSAPVQTLNEQAETTAAEEVRIHSAYYPGSLLTDSRGNWSVISGTSADGITAEATAPDGSTLSTGIPASELGGYTALPITPGTRIGDMTVIASDENGIVLRDGQGREYSPKSPAELADMLTFVQFTPDTQSQSAPAAHSAPASPVPAVTLPLPSTKPSRTSAPETDRTGNTPSNSSPDASPSEPTSHDIPTDRNGEPIFEQMSYPDAAALIARLGEETAERFISNNINAARRAHDKAAHRTPRATTFNALLAEQAEIEADRQAAASRLHWWQGLRRHIDTQREAQAAENIRTPEEAQDLAAQSLDPLLIAAEYTREKETATPHAALLPWQRELLGTKFTTRSFDRFADTNLRTGSLARAWLSDTEGRAIDGVAQELSTNHGTEVTPQMIADFIVDNPTGYVPKTTERMKDLNARFKQLAARDGYKVGGIESDTGRMYIRMKQLQREADEKEKAAKTEAVRPVGVGSFGPIYDQFRGRPKEAVTFLSDKKDGEAVGALSHPEIGSIDLVWGKEGSSHSDGYGLSKLIKWHPEVVENLQEILNDMHITSRTENRVQLESDKYQAAVRLTWDNENKTWLLTAFQKKNSASDNTTDTVKTQTGERNDTATPQDTVSDSKDTENIPDKQGNTAENTDDGASQASDTAADTPQDIPAPSAEDTDTDDNWLDRAWEDRTPLPFRIGNPARRALYTRRDTADRALREMNLGSSTVTYITSPDQIPDPAAKAAVMAGANVAGWYSPASDTVYIYIPNVTTLNDTRKTILHELVAHKGLRSLLGRDFDTLCDNVWEAMDDTSRRRFAAYVWDTMSPGARERVLPAHGGTAFADIPESQLTHFFSDSGIQRAAADECMAHFAEEGVKETMSLWQKISALVRQALRKIGAVRMTDADLAYLLYRSRRRLTEDIATPLRRFSLHGERLRIRRSLSSPSASRSLGFPSPMNLHDMEAARLRIAPAANEWDVTPEAYEEMQAIKARAVSGGTFMKAPDGSDTRLTERQWLQVRTAPFKAWFGDWEKAARIEKLRRSEPLSFSGNDYQGKYELNPKSATRYILDNLRGDYVNQDTGETIRISRKGAEKVMKHDVESEAHLKSVAYIPQMIENSTFISEETNTKGKTGFDTYRYYVVGLRMDDVDYTAKLVIGVKDGEAYYDHALTEIEKNSLLESIDPINTGFADKKAAVSEYKDKRLISLLQTNSSKVVDGNGEPKVVKHGTPNTFTAFDKDRIGSSTDAGWLGSGFYFYGNADEYAGQYSHGGNVMELFLNVRDPYVASYGEMEELAEKNDREASDDFTAQVTDEGHDGVYYNEDLNEEWVVYEPSQIKSATDNNGEFSDGDNDIRFRITQPVEQSGNLIAVHNLSKEKLREAFELGGFPMPSIAITKADMGHTEFGDISLVFGKETIDPADSRNKVYGEDAWTPTFPSVGYKLNDDKTSDIYRRANKAGSLPMFRPVEFHPDNYERYISGSGSESLVEHFKDDYGAKQLFLSETGNAVEKYEQHEVDKYLPDQTSLYEKVLEKIGIERLKNDSYDALENEMRRLIGQHYGIDLDAMKPFRAKARISNTISRVVDYAENGNKKTETDIEATKRKIDERTDPKKFAEWLEDMFSGIVEKRGIRNDRDPFTPSGNSRKWEALYDDITLDNVVRAMQRQSAKGGQGLFGGSIFGAAQEEYKSIDDIRKAAQERIRSISHEEYEAQRKAIIDRLSAIEIPGAGERVSDTMDMVQNIQDAVARSHTPTGIHRYLKEFYPKVTMETADEIADIVKDIQRLNARYFEAKPYRAVGFGEVRLAVVPEGTDADIISGLDSYRIPVRTYSRGDMTQRVNVLNDAANELGIRFRVIGERGARNLDAAEEATVRMDNLSVAREMEKAYNDRKSRIEKLRRSNPVEITGEEITPSDDLKQYKRNALEYGKTLQGSYVNMDTGREIQLQRGRKNGGLKEVLQHDINDPVHLQSVAAIPQIIERSIYIDSAENRDKDKNPNVSRYHYYVCGLRIGNEDYTVRMVEAEENDGSRYYDHKLTHIEKGKLIDELARLNVSSSTELSSTPGTGAGERNRPTNRGEIQTAPISESKDKVLLSLLQTNDRENAKKIKAATGWERGADGKWRYETDDIRIRDSFAEIMKTIDLDGKRKYSLDEVLDNAAELYAAYPELRKVKVKILHPDAIRGYAGSYNGKTLITMSSNEIYHKTPTLAHEIQHAIQRIEGFASGGNRNSYRQVYGNLTGEDRKMRDMIAEEVYNSLGGEVEARNVERRMDMTAGERLRTLLEETEDVAREDQILIYNNIIKDQKLSSESLLEYFNRVAIINNNVRFRITPEIREANERFNEELEKYKYGKMRSSDMFNLGVPSDILKAAGINGNEIVLTQNVLREHLDKHGLDAADIKDLPLALQEPIMVYEWGDKAKSSVVITDIPKGNDRITTAIRTSTNGKEIEVSRIASVHPKSVERLLKEMDTEKSDFAKDNLRYVDKRKALDWIAMVSPEETSQSGQGLDSAAKIIQNFENPKLPEDLQREADNLRYRIANDPAAVYPEPQRREGESLMDYFRRYAEWREKKIEYKHLTGEEIPPYPRYTPGESLIEWFETYQAYRLGVEDAQAVSEHMRNIQKSGGRLREWQVKWTDSFINLKKFREEMQKAGAKIPPEADFYNAVFLTPFKITRATEKFRAREWKNLLSALARFTSSQGIGNIELKWQNLGNEELKAKGEKRNGTPLTPREIADVYVQAKDIEEARQLGLPDRGAAGFVKNLGVTHTDVIRMVEDNIPSDTVAQLWESIRAATDFALDYEVSHGVISRETRDKYSARKHYVPERGWVERDMDGRKTNYISKGGDYGSQYNPALIRSKGRTSIASSPFPYIQSIAESAIRESELNAEKLAFKRFADTNEAIGVKTGAFEFREAWLLNVKDTDGTTKLGQDGKPLTEVTYARPTAEMFAHDRETDKKIREIRKDIAARQKQSEKTEAKIAKEKSPSADLYDRLNSLQKEINGLEEQITALENSQYIAGNVRSGDIPHRSESEKRQHHVHVRDGGRDYVIFLESESVANAVNRQFDTYRSAFIDSMADTLGRGTRIMASWNTQYNPGFAVANFLRDFQFALLINDATHGSRYAARFARNTFSAFGALHAYASGREDSYTGKYSPYLHEFLDSGALTGYSFTKPVRDIAKDFDRELKKAAKDLKFDELDDGSLGHAIMKFMHDAANHEAIARAAGYLSVISEMAVRFGEYVTARESGLGVQQSASRAKEVSTNFDRHGLYGRQMNRLFAYFNATLQGTVRVAYAYLQSPRAARRLAAFSLAYAAAGFINTMLNPDDPDDEVYLSDYTRMTNLTVGNWRVPLPHYFRMFFALGVQTALALQGRKPWEEALTDTVQFIAGDLLPGALNLTEGFYFDSTTGSMGYDMKRQLRSMMPTVASPIADVGLNMNFMGLPVAKEPFLSTDKGKLSQVNMYNSRTAEPYRYIADAILEMTGGNPDLRYKAGGLDINPSYIEHIVEGYTPGLVKDIAGMTSMLLSTGSKGFNWGHVPVAGRFYNKIDPESVYRSQYWQLKNNIDFYSLQLKDSRKNDRRRYREMTGSPRHEVYLKTRGILRRMDKPVVGEDVSFDAADIRRLMDANIAWTLEDTSAIE